MNESKFKEIHKIEKEQLLRYYEIVKHQYAHSEPIQIIARFLVNQSIGSSFKDVCNILEYFNDKLASGKELIDFALEWIRAQKIRLEYKKYLIRAQYPFYALSLAVDDCIFRFFLEYDKFIRKLLRKNIREHDFSALYEIFFSPYDSKNLNIDEILKRHIDNVPTHFDGIKRINTNIIILRSGLSVIIVKDYEKVLFSRREEKYKKKFKLEQKTKQEIELENNFRGLLLERMIKTYSISKKDISDKEIENAISQFLSSYFKFGILYDIDKFRDLLIQNMADDIFSGLTEIFRKKKTLESIKNLISKTMLEFNQKAKVRKLDGLAWKKDLIPILKNLVINFINNLLT